MMKNKITTPKEDYKNIIYSGCYVESNGVSVCNLNDYINGFNRDARYQVWSDKHRVYELYQNLDEAVEKFLELKKTRGN